MPRLGGVAIFAASALTLFGLIGTFGATALQLSPPLLALLAGAAAMHVWGLIDDVRPMRARYKLVGQVVIVAAVYAAGLRMTSILLPFAGAIELGAVLSAILTVTWLVGITNAFNLIDGMDGLAGGAAVLALATFFAVGDGFDQFGVALIAVVIAGATAGFLRYNFNPATIFLGDSGSLFLGFSLAGLGLLAAQRHPGAVALAIPAVVLGLPELDTAITICRRFLRGDGIFFPDRGHLHHRLLDHGHSTREVALILYAACAVLSMAGFILANHADFVLLLLAICAVAALFITRPLRFYEFEELGNVLGRALRQREVIGRSVRFREAGLRLSGVDDLIEIFATLETAFDSDKAWRAEVRLTRGFLRDWSSETATAGRADDEMPVWSWHRDKPAPSGCWEIGMPLLAPDGRRIGSLVVFEDGVADPSLSHLQAIGAHLSKDLQRKLYLFGWPLSGPLNPDGLPVLEKVVRIGTGSDSRRLVTGREMTSSPGRRLLRRFTPASRHTSTGA